MELDERFYKRNETLDGLARQNTGEPAEDVKKEMFEYLAKTTGSHPNKH